MMRLLNLKKTGFLVFFVAINTIVFGQAKSDEQIQKLNKALKLIKSMYVDSVTMNQLVEDAIIGALDKLDPHSVYMSAEECKSANESLQGSFDGIGVQFSILNDTIVVVSSISNGPSEKVGVMSGDKIVKVDGINATGKKITNQWVINHLKGKKGSKVVVSIARNGSKELIDFEIIRDKIPIYSLDASFMLNQNTGIIKLNKFGETTMSEFLNAMTALKKKGMKNLILDLRGNSGGYLNTSIHLADQFLEGGKTIVYTEGLYSPKKYNKATFKGEWEKNRLIVLIDEGSASASEIVAGAVQDWDRGLVIGRRSFGKGLVQKSLELSDGSMIRLTIARYHTPSGRCIQKSYRNGQEAYADDLNERYENGEFYSKDSIKILDTVKYYTEAKRLVFGGGGIMPDIFVPLDTTYSSKYYTNLVRKGVINNFVVAYLDKHRERLSNQYVNFKAFKDGFAPDDNFVKEMVDYAAKNGVVKDENGYKKSLPIIKIQLKALLARNLFDISAYYETVAIKDETIKKALEVLNDGSFEKMKIKY